MSDDGHADSELGVRLGNEQFVTFENCKAFNGEGGFSFGGYDLEFGGCVAYYERTSWVKRFLAWLCGLESNTTDKIT